MSAREELADLIWDSIDDENHNAAADAVLANADLVLRALVEAGTIEPVTEQVGWTEWPIEGVFRLRPRSQG